MEFASARNKSLESPSSVKTEKISKKLQWVLNSLNKVATAPAVVHLNNGEVYQLGEKSSPAQYEIFLKNDVAVAAITSLDEIELAEAYISGDIEITDLFDEKQQCKDLENARSLLNS